MIELGTLQTKLNFALGTSETNLMTEEKRTDALNRAVQYILQVYPIPQYVISDTVSFTSGVGSLPDNCLIPLKLNVITEPTTIYNRVTWDDFQNNVDYTYTILFDEVTDTEKIHIYGTSATSLQFWYILMPEEMEDDADTVRFNTWWSKAIAEKAAEFLLIDTAAFNRATAKAEVAEKAIADAWQMERARITGVQDNKMKSIYTKYSLLQ